MKGPQAVGISLWLVPEGMLQRRLTEQIASLAARHATPRFEPHVTLLGGLTLPEVAILDGAEALAAGLRPLTIRLTGLDDSEEYFRCVVLSAAEEAGLSAAHALARERFGRDDDPVYRPHLSLVYGELDAPARERIRAEIGDAWPRAVLATALEAVRTEGPPVGWRSLARWPLVGPRPQP